MVLAIKSTPIILRKKELSFFSGTSAGFYIKIGQSLESYFQQKGRLQVINNISKGSNDNAEKVAQERLSLGLVQEEIRKNPDLGILFQTPLYSERMHIIYRKDSDIATQYLKKSKPVISTLMPPPLLSYFANAKISIGEGTSGTLPLATILMNLVNQQINLEFGQLDGTTLKSQGEILYEGMSNSFNKLQSGDLDVMFAMGGFIEDVNKLLRDTSEYGLINIEPSTVIYLNDQLGYDLKITSFRKPNTTETDKSEIYPNSGGNLTLGSYCYLVSSPDVDKTTVWKVLKAIDQAKNEILAGQYQSGDAYTPLRELQFLDSFENVNNIDDSKTLTNLAFLSVLSYFFAFLCLIVLTALWFQRTIPITTENRFNPYVVGEAIHGATMFFGRKRFMQDLFQTVMGLNGNSVWLYGERRIGKTTILEQFDNTAPDPLFTFVCNLESVKPETFFLRIIQSLVSTIEIGHKIKHLNLDFYSDLRNNYDDLNFENDIYILLNFLQENYNPDAVIVMCLDEIDATEDFPPNLHQSLRNVFQTLRGKIRMIATGVYVKKGDWNLPTSPWYNFFEFKEVRPISPEEAKRLITDPVKRVYSFHKEAIDFIIQKTDCKPYFIQTICKKSIERILDGDDRRRVFLNDVRHVYQNLILLTFNQEFEKFWESLSTLLQDQIIEHIKSTTPYPYWEGRKELEDNLYNRQHRVVYYDQHGMKLSTIFSDWLNNQHFIH